MTLPRSLEFRDRWRTTLEGTSDVPFTDCNRIEFVPSSEPQVVVLQLTGDEFTQIFSALQTGVDLSYPDEAEDILLTFLKGVDCPVNFCDFIADCIANDAGVQSALSQYLQDNGFGSGDGNPDSPLTYNANDLIIDGSTVPGCDNDSLFGAVTQLVDFMNTVIEDFFQSVEGASEGVEKWGAILEAIPITNVLAIDDLVQFADQFVENIGQSYSAQYTVQLRDQFRCDLFCLTKDTCEMDFQVWADYFMGLLGQAIVENSFSNAISWFLGGNFSNEEIVYAAHALAVQVLAYGSKFLGMDMAYLGKVVTAALNDPDPDWSILCECGTGAFAHDFATGLGQWSIGNGRGTVVAGGVESVEFNNTEQLQLYIRADTQVRWSNFSAVITRQSDGSVNDDLRLFVSNANPPTPDSIILDFNVPSQPNGQYIHCHGSLSPTQVANGLYVIFQDNQAGNKITVHKIKVWTPDADPPSPFPSNSDKVCYS